MQKYGDKNYGFNHTENLEFKICKFDPLIKFKIYIQIEFYN